MSKSNRQFEKVFAVFLAAKGELVSKAYLETNLADSVELYRLSTYVWNMRKKLGADVKVVKEGKLVTGYKLVNHEKFKDFGKVDMTPVAKPAKTPRKASGHKPGPIAKAALVKTSAPAEAQPPPKIGEVSAHAVDPDFDRFDVSDILAG